MSFRHLLESMVGKSGTISTPDNPQLHGQKATVESVVCLLKLDDGREYRALPQEIVLDNEPVVAQRRCMPDRSYGPHFKVRIGGQCVHIQAGEYPDDRSLGQVFVDVHKAGSDLRTMIDCFAILFSKALQWGVPLTDLIKTFTLTQFEPSGIVEGHPDIVRSTSLIDLLMRVLALEYLGHRDLANAPDIESEAPAKTSRSVPKMVEGNEGRTEQAGIETPHDLTLDQVAALEKKLGNYGGECCKNCGSNRMRRTGVCLTCEVCGTNEGCG